MQVEPIIFADISERADIDILGGWVEVATTAHVLRGTIEALRWWPGNFIRSIKWVNARVWDPAFAMWYQSDNLMLEFNFGMREHFRGPYATKSGELFFIFGLQKTLIYVTLFPVGCEPPEFPYDIGTCYEAHGHYMSREPFRRRMP